MSKSKKLVMVTAKGDIQGDNDFVQRRARCIIVTHAVMQEGTVQDGETLPGGEGAVRKGKGDPPAVEVTVEEGR